MPLLLTCGPEVVFVPILCYFSLGKLTIWKEIRDWDPRRRALCLTTTASYTLLLLLRLPLLFLFGSYAISAYNTQI